MECKRTALLTTGNIPIEITVTDALDGTAWVQAHDLIYGFKFNAFGVKPANTVNKLMETFMSETNKLFVFLDKSGTLLTVSVVTTGTAEEHIYFKLYDTLTNGDVTLADVLNMSNNPTTDDLLVSFATVVKKFNEYRNNN